MLHWPLYLQQPSQLLSSSTDIDLLLIKIGCHDLRVLWSTDTERRGRLARLASVESSETSSTWLTNSGNSILAVPGLRNQL